MAELFDPAGTPLNAGVNLIEASAGTGKTFTITMLVLRLVLEKGIPIEKILVVTFTKAATEELKERIRNRFAELRQILNARQTQPDKVLEDWLQQCAVPEHIVLERLTTALLNIDQAGIFTIHSFCQRILREHALACGHLFDAELTGELAAVRLACTDDFWRCHVLSQQPEIYAILTRKSKSPESLLESIGTIPPDAEIHPLGDDLETLLHQLPTLTEQCRLSLGDNAQNVRAAVQNQLFKTDYSSLLEANVQSLEDWLQGKSFKLPADSALKTFTYQSLWDNLNGRKFLKNKNQTADQRKAEFIESLAIDTRSFDLLLTAIKQIGVALRTKLAIHLRNELDRRLEQMNLWSFDGLISHLADALSGARAEQLCAEIRQRFLAALIDEFQDTDNQQWHIFSRIFAVDSHFLMLVGDPKQAIYKFRGADIFSYLAAKEQAAQIYTLGFNRRSHPGLVNGVNHLFDRQDIFLTPGITFQPVQPACKAEDGALYLESAPCSPLMLWHLGESESSSGYWTSGKASSAIQIAVVEEIINLLNQRYILNFADPTQNRTVRPGDIAILVRTNQHAEEFQHILREVNIPSVLNSHEPVFASDEACALYILLNAIAHPGNTELLGQALALHWFGHDGQAIRRILQDENEIDALSTRFQSYYATWQKTNVMSMMAELLEHEGIAAKLSRTKLAERRLTNLQHLLELIQQAVIDEHLGIHKTLDWLKKAMTDTQSGAGAEEAQLRLESDDDAVKIITMHRAKGLEYPIVFCPYLWHVSTKKQGLALAVCHVDDENSPTPRLVADLGSENFQDHDKRSKDEEYAEYVRLAYVALTRAKYRCYAVWADVRTNDKFNTSALARLLDCAELDFDGQQKKLHALAESRPESFGYRLLHIDDTTLPTAWSNNSRINNRAPLTARDRRRSLSTDWQMSSYTALSALSLTDAPELPTDKADERHADSGDSPDALPAGPHFGNVIHEILENADFSRLVPGAELDTLRKQACQRYGLRIPQPDQLDRLLFNTLTTPLSPQDSQFCLQNLPAECCLKEMPFYLTMPGSNTSAINRILGSQPTLQPLSNKQMSGFLTGFIDLICEYQGRFYVMDYKTNRLPDYHLETLIFAMREHNYGLQYWLYSVVLHRYLQQRLPAYDFKRHFGGIRYLFVRGMTPQQPMSGVFEDMPDFATLEALSDLFKP